MIRSVNNLLDIARGQIGYYEKNSNANLDDNTANAGNKNYTKYARDLHGAGYYQASKQGFEWCDVWVDWCFWQLCEKDAKLAQEMTYQSGPYGAGCEWSAEYYERANRYFTTNPQAGDQIFFGDFDHTGIIESVSATTITTIEGNASNKVKRVVYSIDDDYITGFGRPNYEKNVEEPATKPVTPPAPTTPATPSTNTASGTHTVKSGESWWSIAEDELGSGTKMHELAAFNGTTINKMLHPGNVLKIPGKVVDNTTAATKPVVEKTHTVKPGESWWSIAEDELGCGTKMHELAKYNGTTITKMLHPGNVLKIPG